MWIRTLCYHAYYNNYRSCKAEPSSAAIKIDLSCIFIFLVYVYMYASCVCLSVCLSLCMYTLTVDLQHFRGLLWCLCECHMVHFAGVGHSIIISVHMKLQRAPYCKCLPTCIHLFGTFGKSYILSDTAHLSCKVWWCRTPTSCSCIQRFS